jgi:broad specificity phosphatase PhoE
MTAWLILSSRYSRFSDIITSDVGEWRSPVAHRVWDAGVAGSNPVSPTKIMKTTRIYLVRHGESVLNKQGILSGQVNPEMTDEGRDQVRRTKQELRNVKFDVAYSSKMVRAMETADILYSRPIPDTNRLHGLRERSFGSWDGKPDQLMIAGNAIRQKLPHEEGMHFKHVPDMESDHELTERFIPVLQEIAEANPGKTILIAAHGGVIRTAVMKLGNLTYQDLPAKSFKNAGYAVLEFTDGAWKVIQISGVEV